MIEQIQLADYRSHKATNIFLSASNLFLGAMGSGKSSVLHALSLLLCGENPIINRKGEGLRMEIRLGSDSFRIACRMSGGIVIDQAVNAKTNRIGINGDYSDVRLQRGTIKTLLKCSPEIVQLLLDPSPIWNRKEEDQRKVLLQLMSQAELEAPPLVKKMNLATSFRSVGVVDEMIKSLKEVRIRDLNREVDKLQAQIPEAVELAGGKVVDVAPLKARRDTAIAKQAAHEEWKRTLESLQKEAAGAEGVATLKAKLTSTEEQWRVAQQALENLRAEYHKKLSGLNEGKEKVSATNQNVIKLRATLKSMSGMGAKCGVVDIFKCPLTVADMKKMHGEVTIQLQDAEADLEALSSGVKGLQGDVTGLETKGAEQKKEYERLTGEVATVKQAITHAEDLAARLAKHQSSSLETGNWPDELAKASEALTAAEIKNLDIQKAQDINASRSLQVTAVRSKQSEAEELKAAVEELAALKETLLKAGSSHFVEEMQAILSEFGFEQVEYSNEPFGFFADGLGAEQLSGGQKVLLEAALRLAAAKASGLNIMALDDANKLGEKARNKLAGILLKAGVQVIICSTTEIRPEPQKLPEGFKILWFTNESPIGPTVVDNIHA